MVKVKKYRLGLISCLLTGILIGIISGIIGFSVLISYRIDGYHKKINYLEAVIEDKNTRLAKLEESINKSKFVLKEIEVFLIYDQEEDAIEKIELEKSIKEKYSMILGKEVNTIDIEMVAQIIDKRIMRFNGREYQTFVDKVMLSDVLKLWVRVNIDKQGTEE